MAAVLLFSPAAAVGLIGLSRLLGEGVLCLRRNPATGYHRRQPVDLVFNKSQLMLAGGFSAILYRGVAFGADLPAAFLAGAGVYDVSQALGVHALRRHTPRST